MLKVSYHPCYHHTLPEGHRFPMLKYSLLHDQLLYKGIVEEENFFVPDSPSDDLLTLAHDKEYLRKLKNLELSPLEIRKTGFPMSGNLVKREWIITNGTWLCCRYALENGAAANIAGGTHHAFRDRGEGFCILNDQAVAATNLLAKGFASQIMIVDLDVHQGDGTARIFESESRVFTFSVHGAGNYPARKEKSDMDIAFPDHTGDKEYLSVLSSTLPGLLDKVKPDFVFYQAGVDVLETDKLGKLSLSSEGCRKRDELVLSFLKQRSLPVVVTMGGGYSEKIGDIVDAHSHTYEALQEIYF